MDLRICQWLQDLPVSATVRSSLWVFPALESVHIYSMIFLVTCIGAFDLRLSGFLIVPESLRPFSKFTKVVLRWASLFITLNLITGGFLFAAKASEYYLNPAFRIKMLLIFSGVAYHALLLPLAAKWNDASATSGGPKLAGLFSLCLWIGVIAAARWMAFM